MPIPSGTLRHLCAGAAIALACASGADAREYSVAPSDAWVTPAPAGAASSTQHATGGVHYEVLDTQWNFTLHPPRYYFRSRLRVLNQEGLAEAAQFTLDFDPSDERLTVHSIRIERAGMVLDALADADQRVLRREQRLEYQIFDGRRTLVISLKDVRVGDVIDMAYTRTGENPALAGHPAAFVLLASPRAVGTYRHRVIWPTAQPAQLRLYAGAPEPEIERSPAAVEYRWTLMDIRPPRRQTSLPVGYNLAPQAEITSFTDWNAIALWGARLYSPSSSVAPSVRAVAREIADAHPDVEQRTLAALAFVQDEVRYLGDFLGAGAYRPRPAAEVLSRRYGDCKGKVALLLELLRALDVPAVPALMSSSVGRELDRWLPDPRLFDHVIVRVTVGGRHHWLDPTLRGQRGATLAHRSAATGEWALVLSPDTRELERMDMTPEMRPDTRIRKHFSAASYSEPARLTVTSEYRGWAAVQARLRTMDENVIATGEAYERFYREYYPDIRLLDSLEIDDEADSNLVRIFESYEIPNFWMRDSISGRYTADLSAFELTAHLPEDVEADREMPLGLPGPQRVRCETRLESPEGWGIEASSREVSNYCLRMRSEERAEQQWLYLVHEIESFAWFVPADVHRKEFHDTGDMFEFVVTSSVGRVRRPVLATLNPPFLTTLFLALVSSSVLIVWGLRQRAPSWWLARVGAPGLAGADAAVPAPVSDSVVAEETVEPDSATTASQVEPLPIGGWLVVLAIGIVLSPIRLAFDLGMILKLMDRAIWDATLDSAGAARNLMAITLLFEAVASVILVTGAIWLVVTFFRRKRIFPFLYVVFTSLAIAILVTDLLLTSQVASRQLPGPAASLGQLIGSIIGLAIWSNYLVRSRRAQQTFVR